MNRIRDIRQARGMTQKELADRLGVNQSMISDYESGKVDLSLTKAVKNTIKTGLYLIGMEAPERM